jgi:hypothetical protein
MISRRPSGITGDCDRIVRFGSVLLIQDPGGPGEGLPGSFFRICRRACALIFPECDHTRVYKYGLLRMHAERFDVHQSFIPKTRDL